MLDIGYLHSPPLPKKKKDTLNIAIPTCKELSIDHVRLLIILRKNNMSIRANLKYIMYCLDISILVVWAMGQFSVMETIKNHAFCLYHSLTCQLLILKKLFSCQASRNTVTMTS